LTSHTLTRAHLVLRDLYPRRSLHGTHLLSSLLRLPFATLHCACLPTPLVLLCLLLSCVSLQSALALSEHRSQLHSHLYTCLSSDIPGQRHLRLNLTLSIFTISPISVFTSALASALAGPSDTGTLLRPLIIEFTSVFLHQPLSVLATPTFTIVPFVFISLAVDHSPTLMSVRFTRL
jgi:hypothetical protein